MSWFQERAGYADHMNFREKNPNTFVVKHGTNKHSDHSKVLSNDLLINQTLVDTYFYKIMSLLPSQSMTLPLSIEIYFDENWLELNNNDSLIVGSGLPYKLLQNGNLLREGRLLLTNWGNRGEPASVYEDAFSRFLIFELKKQRSAKNYEMLTQYGFHKFLNAKYAKLLPEYKLLGVKKELKPRILDLLEDTFGLKVSGDFIILPEVEIKKSSDEELLNFIQQLFVVGLVKEFSRGRLPELQLKL
ncbi:hypothetical protein [Ureibacillus acetophenoni]|uniref:Uncharacterized protein n=1 Tax=Ureibacillus acetophenoni TaxID=614649 RepID=A0A285UJ30_9BACL|nr:hypothetical protein [Ureibacillus acetophenoni]SOC40261.1 hypothetical protein SAMN05877842_107159 [Ureibacillus acetophenoni]